MFRAILSDIWPWTLLLAFVVGLLAALAVRMKVGPWRSRLQMLHGDEVGGVQSLSFVLTVPVFIALMMLAVQITQMMIGMIVVHYAAFAAVRSASVWIPANIQGGDEGANQIATRTGGGADYQILPDSPKYQKIRSAAVLACVPIAPSRDLGLSTDSSGMTNSILQVYRDAAPATTSNTRLEKRLANKWAYADSHTSIAVKAYHHQGDAEPPLAQWLVGPYWDEYQPNELGWRDRVTITVTHQFALLPGPGRLLARRSDNNYPTTDAVSSRIKQADGVYYVNLEATATLGIEGEKSLVSYAQTLP